ncbi:hypothetical protein HRbin14_01986 [bacterium HR14]|nr:hypothetical protein HRbin14_01986 [bacterium HR14]
MQDVEGAPFRVLQRRQLVRLEDRHRHKRATQGTLLLKRHRINRRTARRPAQRKDVARIDGISFLHRGNHRLDELFCGELRRRPWKFFRRPDHALELVFRPLRGNQLRYDVVGAERILVNALAERVEIRAAAATWQNQQQPIAALRAGRIFVGTNQEVGLFGVVVGAQLLGRHICHIVLCPQQRTHQRYRRSYRVSHRVCLLFKVIRLDALSQAAVSKFCERLPSRCPPIAHDSVEPFRRFQTPAIHTDTFDSKSRNPLVIIESISTAGGNDVCPI